MSSIPINSGTGPGVAIDLIGTDNFQVVKLMLAASGVSTSYAAIIPITGSVGIAGVTLVALSGTGNVSVVNTHAVTIVGTSAVTAANVTVASITTGTVSIFGTVAVSGGGGGAQYSVGATDMGATGTGTIFLGVQSGATTGRAIAITTTGGLIIASMPAVGGGQQYPITDTSMGATGTGTIVLGMQTGATTGRGLAVTTTGAQYVVFAATQAVTAANVTIASITTGTLNVINTVAISGTNSSLQAGTWNVATVTTLLGVVTVTGAVQPYIQGATGIAATGTGTLMMGIQGTTAFGIGITGSNQQLVSVANTVTVTGTVGALMLQKLDNTNDSILVYGVQTGSAVNQPLAVTTTGAQYVLFAATQPVTAGLITTTANIAIIGTAHASRFNAFAVATTSAAAGVIVKTSGASTLYITDILVAVPTPNNVGLYSETTGPLAFAYLAANGGFQMNLVQPLVCTTAQSLRVILSSSGSCSVSVVGYTVT